MKNEGKWNGELHITSRDGRRGYFMVSFQSTFDGQDNLLYTLASFVNFTEYKDIETALNSTRQKLSETIDFMSDPTFIVTPDRQVIAWNRALELLTGVKKDEIIGKKDYQKAFTFFQKERPEYVFLAAAKVGGILANGENLLHHFPPRRHHCVEAVGSLP